MQKFKNVGDTLPSFAVKETTVEDPVGPEDIFVKEVVADPPKLERQEAVSLDSVPASGSTPVVQEITKEKVGRGKRGPDRAKRKKRQMTPEALEKLAKAREKALRVRRERAAERKKLKESKKPQLKQSPTSSGIETPNAPVQEARGQMSKFNDEDYESYVQFKEFQRRQRARKSKKTVAAPAPARQLPPVRKPVQAKARQSTPDPRVIRRPTQKARAAPPVLRRPPPVNPWESCFNYK